MANTSRFAPGPAAVAGLSPKNRWWRSPQDLEEAVLTSGAQPSEHAAAAIPEQLGLQISPAPVLAAPWPVSTTAPSPSVLLSGDPLTLAVAKASRAVVSPSEELAPPASIDLDAMETRVRFGRCSCAACNFTGRSPAGATSVTTKTSSASAMPMASLQTLADYLTTGYWQEDGTYTRKYNLTNAGTGAKSGVITYNVTGWADDSNGLSTDRQALTREVFKLYSAVLGITFREVTGSGGDIRFTDNDTGAYAYMASGWYADSTYKNVIINYSVVNVQSSWYDGKSDYNTYTPQTIFHEIGHALGLGHQGQYNYTGTPLTYDSSAQFGNDSWLATMMSYWDQSENPTTGASFAWLQTPMAVDWIALNDLYRSQGYSTDKAFQGNTVYGIGTTITAAQSQIWNAFSTYAGSTAYTLVDGSGYDTLDVSNFTANQLINLAPSQPGATTPSVSNIGGKIGNLTIAAGTIIEAANSGSGADTFYGNGAANTFRGNGGNDSFFDSLGSDIYYGDAGTDWLYFSESIDLLNYSLSGDSLLFSRRSGSVDVDQVWSGLENLSFNNVVYTYAQLVQNASANGLPVVGISHVNDGLSSGSATSSTALTFSGTLSQSLAADQAIAFYRDGVQVGTATPTAPGATSWSFALQEASGVNSFSYSARVLAAGGQSGPLSSPFLLTVDTLAPVVTVDGLETYDTTPLLGGTVDDGTAQVSVTVAGLTRTAVNNGAGRWTLQWNDELAAGQIYEVAVTARDAAGNSASDSSRNELNLRLDDFAANTGSTGQVSLGGSRSGALELAGDRDWFAVDLEAGRSYQFRLDGTSLADPLLNLLSGSGGLLASNDDASSSTFNSLIRFTATTSGRHYLEAAAYNDAGAGTYTVAANDVTPPPSGQPSLFFSLASAVSTASPTLMGGLTARTNDIIAFDGSSFSIWLDGNASGLSGAVLRDFHVVSSNEVVLAFQNPITLAGIAFDDSDLARLTRTGSGFALSMLFDGSDVGLTTTSEAIDAITGLANGSWLISTRGSGSVPVGSTSLSFAAEDLLRFTPSTLGASTSGGWSLYADMSDVGLSGTAENITAVDVATNGVFYMASQGSSVATGLSAANEDVFAFQASSLGGNTAGSFLSPLFFDGSVHGLGANAIQGLDVAF